jgi:DHA1 family tetracycline resistance protein-like MFS transporter
MRFIMLTVLIDMMSIGLILPVLPMLVGTFTASPAEQAFWTGAVAFAFAIANFFGSAVLGALSDHYGRRPVLLIGFCGLALNFFMTAFATQLWMLVAARFIGGAMQANAAVASAYVADISASEDRARRFGLLGAMFGVGFILGPVMGGLLGGIDLRWPFFVAGGLALLNLLYGYFVLPESLPVERRRPVQWWRANPVTSLVALFQLKGVGPLLVVLAASGLAQFILHAVWVLYTQFRFGWGPIENGWSLFAVGVASAVVQGYLLKKMLARLGAARLALVALVSGSVAYVLWGVSTQGWMMYAVIVCNLFGFSAAAALQSIVSNAADARTQGQTLGTVSSLNSLMAVIAPVIGAPMLAAVSHFPANDWRLGSPFFFCAALQCVAAFVAFRHFAKAPVRLAGQGAVS